MKKFHEFTTALYGLRIPCKVKIKSDESYVVELGKGYPDHLQSKVVDAAYDLNIPYDKLKVCAEDFSAPMVTNSQILCGGPKNYDENNSRHRIKSFMRGRYGRF